MDRLDWITSRCGDFGGLTKLVENSFNNVHVSVYPINGYTMQPPYPIISNAPEVPSWHDIGMGRVPSSEGFNVDRVRARMDEMGVNQTELAKFLGLNQSAISNLLKGKRQVKVHEAIAIEKYLGLVSEPLVAFVPVIGISSAGNWREAVVLPKRSVPIPPGIAGERAFALEVSGDSMDLVLMDGAYIVIDPDQTQLFNDKVYLISNTEHETQIKLYRGDPARFEPRSSNGEHKPIFMGEEPITVIGRVVFQGTTV